MTGGRASIFDSDDPLDVSTFAPKPGPDRTAPPQAEVRAVAQTTSFRSREAAPLPSPAPAEAPAKRGQRRYRTGRSVQLNIKASQATVDTFVAISDQCGWKLSETLEHALEALQATLAHAKRAGGL